jgi:dTMP kinase
MINNSDKPETAYISRYAVTSGIIQVLHTPIEQEKQAMRGRFIVLEGIDGSGKTTQVERLRQWLPQSGLMPEGSQLVVTREPGGTALGRELRRILLEERGELTPKERAELLLMMADRAQHVAMVIEPALAAGHWVLCDRFSGSTEAYQGYGRGLPLQEIRELQSIATGDLKPDLVLCLLLPVGDAIRRIEERKQDRIDQEGNAFLIRVSYGYSVLSAMPSWYLVDANLRVDDVFNACKNAVETWIKSQEAQQ